MSRILAVANIKGGVGKTTTVVNLSAALAELDFNVLAIDLDPQSSLTLSMGVKPEQVSVTIRQMLESPGTALWPIRETAENWSFIPANVDLRVLEHELETNPHRIPKVAAGLHPLRERYDFILLDCPASAGPLIGAALTAADQVIIPLTPDYLAFQVSRSLFRIIKAIRQNVNPRLRVGGIFLTMYDTRTRYARDFMTTIHETYEDVPFFSAVVRQSVKVKEAPSLGQSVLRHAPDSQAAKAYRVIAHEIVHGIATPLPVANESSQGTERTLAPIVVAPARAIGTMPVMPTVMSGQTPGVTPPAQVAVPAAPFAAVGKSFAVAATPIAAPAKAGGASVGAVVAMGGADTSTGDAAASNVPAFLTRRGNAVVSSPIQTVPNTGSGNWHYAGTGNGGGDLGGSGADVTRFNFTIATPAFEPGLTPAQEIGTTELLSQPTDPHMALRAAARAAAADTVDAAFESDVRTECEHVLFISTREDAQDLMEDALVLLETGFGALAQQVFERVTELEPGQVEGWVGLARLTDDPLERVKHLQKALYLKPGRELRGELAVARQILQEHAYTLLEEGTAQSDPERMAQAHMLFQYAVTIDPNDERAWLGCARTADNLVEKMNYLKRVRQLNPHNKDAKEMYGILGSFLQAEPTERWTFKANRKSTVFLGLVLIGMVVLFFALPWVLPGR